MNSIGLRLLISTICKSSIPTYLLKNCNVNEAEEITLSTYGMNAPINGVLEGKSSLVHRNSELRYCQIMIEKSLVSFDKIQFNVIAIAEIRVNLPIKVVLHGRLNGRVAKIT